MKLNRKNVFKHERTPISQRHRSVIGSGIQHSIRVSKAGHPSRSRSSSGQQTSMEQVNDRPMVRD